MRNRQRPSAQQLDTRWSGWRNTNTTLRGVVLPSSHRINIWVTIPPHGNIVVSHQPSGDRGHVHVEVAIKDAFAAARRQIEALAQRASGKVKLHEVDAHGRVSKISAEEDYGIHRNTG